MERTKRFIILPDYGYKGRILASAMLAHRDALQVSWSTRRPEAATVTVVDRIGGDGPLLVETSEEGELALKAEFGTRAKVIPLIFYHRPDPRPVLRASTMGTLQDVVPAAVTIALRDVTDGSPVEGASVVAFTNFRHRTGASAESGPDGKALLALAPGTRVERLYVFPRQGHWSHLKTSLALRDFDIRLQPIRPDDPRHLVPLLYGSLPRDAGAGVRVGVIDTGVDRSHPDLFVEGGRNCVFDEISGNPGATGDFDDVSGHGTHVAGIVAGRGGIRGVAPGAAIRAYRVFPPGDGASNFDIMKAIDFAVEDGCQVLNLSLGGPDPDDAVRGAIGNALSRGTLVVAAAGNDGRGPVLHPAAYDPVVAISAMGLRGTFPTDGAEQADIAKPFSTDVPGAFLAGFSNVGPQVDFTGPGVGIVSTYPGGHYTAMNGTSMAAPAIAGFAAALLSADPDLLATAGEDRAVELLRRLSATAVRLGLGRDAEGLGLPLPPGVDLEKLAAGLSA